MQGLPNKRRTGGKGLPAALRFRSLPAARERRALPGKKGRAAASTELDNARRFMYASATATEFDFPLS